jgi:ligand-binding sensor domain-containing protein/signal transduction histidine kinase
MRHETGVVSYRMLAASSPLAHHGPVVPNWRRWNWAKWLMALACLLSGGAAAQVSSPPGPGLEESPFAFRVWRASDGLPQDSVWAIVQTGDGYLWVGTSGGLARFDGVRFEVFGPREGLPNVQVRALLEDRRGALWVGTAQGLCRLQAGQFTSWTAADGLAGDIVSALCEDREGSVWVGARTGLSRWHNGQFEKQLEGVWIRALVTDRNGQVWASVKTQGLLRWDGQALVPATDLKELQALRPTALLRDGAGNLWAADGPQAVCLETNTLRHYGPAEGLPETPISYFASGADGTVWVGTVDRGLYYLRDGHFHPVRQADGLSDDAVWTMMADREHNLWVGTSGGGLTQLRPKLFRTLRLLEERTEVLPLSLAEPEPGVLWVGTLGHGLYRQPVGSQASGLRPGPPSAGSKVGVVFASRESGLLYDRGGALFQWQEGGPVTELCDQATCVCEDRQGGLWVGRENGTLLRLQAGRREECVTGLPKVALTALCQETDGTLWIGSYGGGLCRLKEGRYTRFGKSQGLGSELIRTLWLDSQGTLWIGTEGGGLSCFRGQRIQTFTKTQGLDVEGVLQILEDDYGCLWLGTHRGIVRVLRRELEALAAGTGTEVHPQTWGRADGLLSEQCVAGFNSCLKTRAGLLCFSTVRGIVVMDPSQQGNPSAPPVVWLEEVLLDGQKVALPARSPAGLAVTSDAAPVFRVPPGKPRLEFRYSGLHVAAPEKVRFRYRLEGLDPDWVEAGSRRNAYYSFVPPGSYRFQVAAHNGDGVWGASEASLAVSVLPHFYQTWWFSGLSIFSCMGAAAGAVRYVTRRRLQRRLERLERQNAIERERTRIARDMHDELGARLARISFQGATAKRFLDTPAKAAEQIESMSQTARDLVTSLDEIVWAVEPENDSLESLANYICRFAGECFDNSPVDCQFNLPAAMPRCRLAMDVRHNVFLAVKETLSNVLKHSGASQVELTIAPGAGALEIVVADNGRGIDPDPADPRKRTGHGMTNLRERMKSTGGSFELESGPGRGTRVRLRVPLVEGPE